MKEKPKGKSKKAKGKNELQHRRGKKTHLFNKNPYATAHGSDILSPLHPFTIWHVQLRALMR
jgi:hypothetical protein